VWVELEELTGSVLEAGDKDTLVYLTHGFSKEIDSLTLLHALRSYHVLQAERAAPQSHGEMHAYGQQFQGDTKNIISIITFSVQGWK